MAKNMKNSLVHPKEGGGLARAANIRCHPRDDSGSQRLFLFHPKDDDGSQSVKTEKMCPEFCFIKYGSPILTLNNKKLKKICR